MAASTARQHKSLKKHDHRTIESIAPRWWPVIVGITNDGTTKVGRQRPTVSPRNAVENPAIEGRAFWGSAAVVVCEMPLSPVVFQIIPPAPPTCGLEWIGSDRRPASPRSSSRNSRRQLFSAARAALCIAKQKSRRRPSGADAVPFGCGPIVPGRTTTIEVAIGAARLEKRNTTMATIGTFTKTENGFTGTVKTLSLNVKTVKFVPAEGDSERGPDFRIFAGATDFGAAWKKTARETQREYLSVKLDDPSFPAPIYASLVEAEDGQSHNLIWSRRNGD